MAEEVLTCPLAWSLRARKNRLRHRPRQDCAASVEWASASAWPLPDASSRSRLRNGRPHDLPPHFLLPILIFGTIALSTYSV